MGDPKLLRRKGTYDELKLDDPASHRAARQHAPDGRDPCRPDLGLRPGSGTHMNPAGRWRRIWTPRSTGSPSTTITGQSHTHIIVRASPATARLLNIAGDYITISIPVTGERAG